jgi:hypothetical protein
VTSAEEIDVVKRTCCRFATFEAAQLATDEVRATR